MIENWAPFANPCCTVKVLKKRIIVDWSTARNFTVVEIHRTIIRWCNERKLNGLSFSVLALSVIKLKWEKYQRLFTLTQIVWMLKVHTFLKQRFGRSSLDTIWAYFSTDFQANLIWHQLKVPPNCVKWRSCKWLF